MSNELPLNIEMGALPPNQQWTPQELADAIAARLRITTQQTLSLFVAGSTAPTSDSGPWWKDNQTWWRWNSGTGTYVPQVLDQSSLQYWIGDTAPDPSVYQFWIQTDSALSPLSLRTYYSGSWVDVYAASIANYMTITAFNAAIAAYSTTTQMNVAIAAAIAAIPPIKSYPVSVTLGAPQTVGVDGAATFTKIDFDTETFDPDTCFDTTTNQYTAPVAGYYRVCADIQVDNSTGVASLMELGITITKNGSTIIASSGTSVASPPGNRWYPDVDRLVQLAEGDTIEIRLSAADGTNTGDVTIANNANSSLDITLVEEI